MRSATLLLIFWLSPACDSSIVLGDLEVSARLNAGGAAGASTGGNASTDLGGAGAGSGGTLVFSSDFETGDFSDWGEEGNTLTLSGGVMSVVSNTARTGSSSLAVSLETLNRGNELALDAPYDDLLLGFWLRVDDAYSTYNWVILNIDEVMPGGGLNQLFDLAISAPEGEPHFIIWEKGTLNGTDVGSQIAEATSSFSRGVWVHVEMRLRAAVDDTGTLTVDQDGQRVIALADHPTHTGGAFRLSLGSFASDLTPLPARLWLDDVTVYRL